MAKKDILSRDQIDKIELKIAGVEASTTAEFKVVLCGACWFGMRHRARKIYRRYGMHKAKHRNAVLFLIDRVNKRLFVYGDGAIWDRISPELWFELRAQVKEQFESEDLYQGICEALHSLAHILSIFYPLQGEDENQISNELVIL